MLLDISSSLHSVGSTDVLSSPSPMTQPPTPSAPSSFSDLDDSDTESPLPKHEIELWRLSKEMHELNLDAEITRFIPIVQEAIRGKVRF